MQLYTFNWIFCFNHCHHHHYHSLIASIWSQLFVFLPFNTWSVDLSIWFLAQIYLLVQYFKFCNNITLYEYDSAIDNFNKIFELQNQKVCVFFIIIFWLVTSCKFYIKLKMLLVETIGSYIHLSTYKSNNKSF